MFVLHVELLGLTASFRVPHMFKYHIAVKTQGKWWQSQRHLSKGAFIILSSVVGPKDAGQTSFPGKGAVKHISCLQVSLHIRQNVIRVLAIFI